MCGIFSAMFFTKTGELVTQVLKPLLINGARKRGRDGDGIYIFKNGYIGASRAKPLPEAEAFQAPLISNTYVMVFNGTISNDAELNKEFGYKNPSEVDTYTAIKLWEDTGGLSACEKMVGGYAFCVHNRDNNSLEIAKNFKTLWYVYNKDFFAVSSEKEPLITIDNEFSDYYPKRFPTNTFATVYPDGKIKYERIKRTYWSYTPDLDDNKAVVVTSGGIDSITSAYIGQKIYKKDITLMNFDYGQMAAKKEKEAVEYFARGLGAHAEFMDLRKLGEWGASPLTDSSIELPLGKKSAESTLCWTPGRNMLMLAYAASYAEAKGCKWLIFGNNLEEEACILNDHRNAVRMVDNSLKMPITVKVGDSLLGWDETNKRIEETIVTEVYEYNHASYVEITYWDGTENRKFHVSWKHPFYILGKRYVEAQNIKSGDLLFGIKDTNILRVEKVKTINIPATVYNYHCEPFNNFFIGKNAVLTHNSGYSDNDLDFIYLYNLLLEYGTLKGVQIKRALARLMKPEILHVGNYLGVNYAKTFSCDRGLEKACGTCGCCSTRRHAFKVAGLPDTQEYMKELTEHYVSVEPKKYDIKQLLSLLEE